MSGAVPGTAASREIGRVVRCALAVSLALGCMFAAGCVQNAAPASYYARAESSFASDPVDFDDKAEVEAEAKRLEQERIDSWRARFPVDDYSNTLLIGDSLMQNATSSLRAAMPNVAINADAGRTLETGGLVIDGQSPDAGILDQVRNDEGTYARYVIGAGNNDAGGMPIDAVEEVVDLLGPEKEIYFITMCSLGSPTATDITNQAIEDAQTRYDNVHKIDWKAFVSGRESDFLRDGVHVYRDREPDYAACIKEGLDTVY